LRLGARRLWPPAGFGGGSAATGFLRRSSAVSLSSSPNRRPTEFFMREHAFLAAVMVEANKARSPPLDSAGARAGAGADAIPPRPSCRS